MKSKRKNSSNSVLGVTERQSQVSLSCLCILVVRVKIVIGSLQLIHASIICLINKLSIYRCDLGKLARSFSTNSTASASLIHSFHFHIKHIILFSLISKQVCCKC